MSDSYDVYTLGFSNRSWDDTLDILRACAIERLIDIRTLPGSRRYPHFNKEILEAQLPEAGIEYIHLQELGGYRKGPMSPLNAGWRNDAFRRYADYMQIAEFAAGLERLIKLFEEKTAVYVCTEAVFWRCHRALVSDALLIRGFNPGHIFTAEKVEPHRLTKFARVDGLALTYPA